MTARACPRRGCYRVVDRLNYVMVSVGLIDSPPAWVCDECLEELRGRAAADPAIIVTTDATQRLT